MVAEAIRLNKRPGDEAEWDQGAMMKGGAPVDTPASWELAGTCLSVIGSRVALMTRCPMGQRSGSRNTRWKHSQGAVPGGKGSALQPSHPSPAEPRAGGLNAASRARWLPHKKAGYTQEGKGGLRLVRPASPVG